MKKIIIGLVVVGFLSMANSAMALDFGRCVSTINNKVQKVGGYDPRMLARQCAWNTLVSGRGAGNFKKCMVKGLKRNVRNLKNPESFANNIFNSIKRSCK